MTRIGFSLDWVRFTIDFEWVAVIMKSPSFIGGETQPVKAVLSYNTAVGNEYHSVHWHTEHPEFRVMVEMTGEQLSKIRRDLQSDDKTIASAMREGAQFTRIDFAVDLFDTGGSPIDVEQCFLTDQLMTVAKSVSVVEKKARSESLGATVYIGSRQSERMIRVYDKGKQAKTMIDWLRVEIEVKGLRARQFAHLIEENTVIDAGKSFIRDFIEWSDIAWLEDIWDGDYEYIDIDSIGRPETDRERWLRTVVIPVISDELEGGAEWLRDALEAVLAQVDDRGKHGPSVTRAH